VRRAKEQEARLTLAAELERAGVASLDEGEERFARATALAAQLEQAEPHLEEAAPDGVAALEEEARTRAAERAALVEPEAMTEAAETSVEQADADLAAATDAATRTRTERDALRAELARADEAIVRHERALAELTRARAIDAERIAALPPEAALVEGVATAKAAWTDARTITETLTAELSRMRESGADLALEQETRVRDRLEADRAEKNARRTTLEAEVRIHGGEDLHERVQRAEAELEEKAAILRATEVRALAARELVGALHAARREVQQRLVAPVIARARPYVEALMPGRRLRMGENWDVVGLTSGDHEEDFEALSGGAKEQVSILARLALAEVLGEGGPLPVVLDDCLVNTDRARLAEMMRVLYRASRKFQILVFSCHDVDLERLGESRRFDLGRPAP
jgi:DNA repair exonuclease SbcCD ATPase subunit